ncbi:hypothetical protein HOY80DRAFT_1137150 [Tuber brumale]|nr:hypothetical protein HOY80DRAFT_1137150 [Tuber brumale]
MTLQKRKERNVFQHDKTPVTKRTPSYLLIGACCECFGTPRLKTSVDEEAAEQEALRSAPSLEEILRSMRRKRGGRRGQDLRRKRRIDRGRNWRKSITGKMFKKDGKFSEWDDQGILIKDKEGTEVTKGRRKALVQEWEKQKRLHEGWLKAKGGTAFESGSENRLG